MRRRRGDIAVKMFICYSVSQTSEEMSRGIPRQRSVGGIFDEHALLVDVLTRDTTGRVRCLLSTAHPLIFDEASAAEEVARVLLASVARISIELLSTA
jgi:hypothetical protein